MVMLPTQTWVLLLECSKANLLTLGCGEGNCNVYCKAPRKETRWLVLKAPQLPGGFKESLFKGKVREWCPRVCDQLVHNSLIGWWWGNTAVSPGFFFFFNGLPSWGSLGVNRERQSRAARVSKRGPGPHARPRRASPRVPCHQVNIISL